MVPMLTSCPNSVGAFRASCPPTALGAPTSVVRQDLGVRLQAKFGRIRPNPPATSTTGRETRGPLPAIGNLPFKHLHSADFAVLRARDSDPDVVAGEAGLVVFHQNLLGFAQL